MSLWGLAKRFMVVAPHIPFRWSVSTPCFPLLFLLAAASADVFAQTQVTSRRDQSAVQAVTRSIAAMGGAVEWSQIVDTQVKGSCTAPAAQGAARASFRWTTQGKEFRYETDTVNGGPVYLSAHGKPVAAGGSQSVTLASEYRERMQPFHLPGLPLQMALADAKYSIALFGQQSWNGAPAAHVRIAEFLGVAKIVGSEEEWWFDPGSGLPLQVKYLLPSQTDSIYAQLIWTFGGWSQEASLLLPHQLAQSMNGEFELQSCTVTGVLFNTNPATTLFDAR